MSAAHVTAAIALAERRLVSLRRKVLELNEIIRRSHATIQRSCEVLGRLGDRTTGSNLLADEHSVAQAKLQPATWPTGILIAEHQVSAPTARSAAEKWQMAHQVVAALREAGIECEIVDP